MTQVSKLENVKRMALAMQRYPWEQGVLMQAFLEAGDEETAIALAVEAVHRQLADGRPAMMEGSGTVTDPCACGEGMAFAYARTGHSMFADGLRLLLKWVQEDAPRHTDGGLYHVVDRPEFWVDSFYMLPPYLAAVGELDEAVRQLDSYWTALYQPDKGLLGHIRNMQTGEWVRKACWGVGNGWAMAGMARVIPTLSGHPARERMISRTRQLLDAALPFLREDGLFHDVLDDNTSFVEVNFPQMAAYTIYRGIREGWLPVKYLPYAHRMREAAQAKVDEFGQVTDVCGAPEFNSSGSATEGQAFYILMEAEAGQT